MGYYITAFSTAFSAFLGLSFSIHAVKRGTGQEKFIDGMKSCFLCFDIVHIQDKWHSPSSITGWFLRIIQNHVQDCGFHSRISVRVNHISHKPDTFTLGNGKALPIGYDFNGTAEHSDKFCGSPKMRF